MTWKNIVESERPLMICVVRRMRYVCWISKATRPYARTPTRPPAHTATHTHTQKYVILLFHGYSGFMSVTECYVIRTLPVLFYWPWIRVTSICNNVLDKCVNLVLYFSKRIPRTVFTEIVPAGSSYWTVFRKGVPVTFPRLNIFTRSCLARRCAYSAERLSRSFQSSEFKPRLCSKYRNANI
jgi:hypothetical protein